MKCEIETYLKSKKVPFSLNFGYTTFTFSFIETLSDKSGDLLGLTDLNNHTIKFCTTLNPRQFKEVFFHEIFHILVSFCGIICPDLDRMNKITEEDLVTRISRGWLLFQNLNLKTLNIINSLE